MKFKTNTTMEIPEDILNLDYSCAAKQEKLRIGSKCLYISHTLYTEYVPYQAITRAYRRIENVKGKLCCGIATYEIHHLVLETGGKEQTVLLEGREAAQAALDSIAAGNRDAVIGLPKEVISENREGMECSCKNEQ